MYFKTVQTSPVLESFSPQKARDEIYSRNVLDSVKLHLEATQERFGKKKKESTQLDGNVCELRLDVFLAFRQKTIIRNDCQAVFGLP